MRQCHISITSSLRIRGVCKTCTGIKCICRKGRSVAGRREWGEGEGWPQWRSLTADTAMRFQAGIHPPRLGTALQTYIRPNVDICVERTFGEARASISIEMYCFTKPVWEDILSRDYFQKLAFVWGYIKFVCAFITLCFSNFN